MLDNGNNNGSILIKMSRILKTYKRKEESQRTSKESSKSTEGTYITSRELWPEKRDQEKENNWVLRREKSSI